jgi:GDPmannose 4,6-dehydratase
MSTERDLPLVSIVTPSLNQGRFIRDTIESVPRPAEVELLQGDSAKASAELGWKPTVGFRDLIEMMVKADLEQTERARAKAKGTGT